MRIAIAQMNATVGDLAGNADRIIDHAHRARAGGADIMVTPELALCGYPPEDLLLREDFIRDCDEALARVARAAQGITLVVGHPRLEHERRRNSASVLREGSVLCVYDKQNLPTYTVFDEERYFESSGTPCVFSPGRSDAAVDSGVRANGRTPIGINICADAWHSEAPRAATEAGARLLLVLNASPYHRQKHDLRHAVMRERVAETGLPIVYANLVGAQDELVFDGASFVMDARGRVTHQLPAFEETLGFVDFAGDVPEPGALARRLDAEAEIYSALVLGVRDYVTKNGFPGVIVGVSGGIDSALTLAIATDALGAQRVRAVMMPSRYTAPMSREDACDEARALGVRYSEIPIGPVFDGFLATLAAELPGRAPDATEENLQARIRGTLLMALANRTGAIVLATGNKSEMATGYATLYGDMAGGFAVLKDVEKTLVYALARYRNSLSPVIPERVIERPPSAELKPDQLDQDALPPYPVLDAILEAYVEEGASPEEIVARGHSPEVVARVVTLVRESEYKRRQAPIGVRITGRAFGKDWRMPITNRFRHRL